MKNLTPQPIEQNITKLTGQKTSSNEQLFKEVIAEGTELEENKLITIEQQTALVAKLTEKLALAQAKLTYLESLN